MIMLILTKQFMDDKIVFNLITLMTYSCLKHPQRNDIFKPFPPCFNSFEDLMNQIIEKSKYHNKEIDLLDIDVEGADFKVLLGLNFEKYKPKT